MLLVRAGRQGKTSSHTNDMRQPQARTCAGAGGMRREGASSMSSTPRGPGWAPGPLGGLHPILPPSACSGLAPSSPVASVWPLAGQPTCLPHSFGVRSSASSISRGFLATEAEGEVAVSPSPSACELCPQLSLSLDKAQVDSFSFKTLLDVASSQKPALTTPRAGLGASLCPPGHLPLSNCIVIALKAGEGPGAPAVLREGTRKE